MENEAKQEEKHGSDGKDRERKRSGDGYFVSKKSLWLVAGGALGTLAAIGAARAAQKVRPAVVGAVKEGYAFKEWVASQYEKTKEDVEDIVAEAKHAYHKDLEASAEAVTKEKELLEKTEKAIRKKAARKTTRKGGE